MKTKIKFTTDDKQFRKVMKILKLDFQESLTYSSNYFIIHDEDNLDTGWGGNTFRDCEYKEIDADLFIRTNGSCEENLTDRTKTTPEIHQQIKIQAAQAKMKIAPYIKMLLDNDKEKTINFNCNNYQEVIDLLNTIDEKVTVIINVNSTGN